MMNILEVRDLKVSIGTKVILSDISLSLKSKENYVLFGPNGSGKTTLINAIMGVPPYEIASGKIVFMGEDITMKSVDERSKLGISMGFQNPPEVTGVKLLDLLKLCLGKDEFGVEERKLIEAFKLVEFLDRDINVGFSGGERKRAEILQIIFLRPKLLLLDEPDSGVDVQSLKMIAGEVQRYIESTGGSALIITHKGDILEHIKAKYACVLMEGRMHCFADPKSTFEKIKRRSYEECIACQERVLVGW